MTDEDALDPIPNAIVFNWATIIVLGFGNLAALDFQARVFSAKSPKVAQLGSARKAHAVTMQGGIIVAPDFSVNLTNLDVQSCSTSVFTSV